MNIQQLKLVSDVLKSEVRWLDTIICQRLKYTYCQTSQSSVEDIQVLVPPDILEKNTPYTRFIRENQLSDPERLLLILALVPHLIPDYLEKNLKNNLLAANSNAPIGGVSGRNFSGFLPTGLTYVFLSGGDNLEKRLIAQSIFTSDNFLAKSMVIQLEPGFKGDPTLSGRIVMNETFVELFTTGAIDRSYKTIKYGENIIPISTQV